MPFFTVPTRFGTFRFSASQKGITSLSFPNKKKKLPEGIGKESSVDRRLMKKLASVLEKYFAGKSPGFELPFDLSFATPFQKKVYEATRKIPYGEVRTYGWVAKEIGKPRAARAVGQALNKNPLPLIIPCHRVVAGSGDLCGFGSGLGWKRRLLLLEGLKLKQNKKLEMG